MRRINRIVLHCTATSASATVESIQNYWKNVLGWKSPGYHYLIDRNGKAHYLQPIEKASNGVRGYNADSIHISYIGGKNQDDRTAAQKETMKATIISLKSMLGDIPVLGHRDLSKDLNGNGVIEPHEWVKLCPRFEVKEWLESVDL